MAWETDRVEKKPCPCGSSTYTVEYRSDDWNRYEERWAMDCENCTKQYKLETYYLYRSGTSEENHRWIKK